jgi:hypothetical protein
LMYDHQSGSYLTSRGTTQWTPQWRGLDHCNSVSSAPSEAEHSLTHCAISVAQRFGVLGLPHQFASLRPVRLSSLALAATAAGCTEELCHSSSTVRHARHGTARHGTARQGKARQGKARQVQSDHRFDLSNRSMI